MRRTLKAMTALTLAAAMVLGSAGVVEAKKQGREDCKKGFVKVEKPVVTGGSVNAEKPVKKDKKKEFKAMAVCSESGKIKVKFSQKVEWSEEATATLTDAEGTAVEVTLSKMGKKSAIIEGEGMVVGNTYTLVLSGVKKASEEEFGSITVEVKAKKLKSKCRAKKIGKKIKAKKRNVICIKCNGNVQTKDAEATVTGVKAKKEKNYASVTTTFKTKKK